MQRRRHAELVERSLDRLGEKRSSAKSAIAKTMDTISGAPSGMFDDELLKNCLSDLAAEHFKIAAYRSLITAADDLSETEIARTCREILADAAAMADWLDAQIPEATRMMLDQEVHA